MTDNVTPLHAPVDTDFDPDELLPDMVPFLTSLNTDTRIEDVSPNATVVLCTVLVRRDGQTVWDSGQMMIASTPMTPPDDGADVLSIRTLMLGPLMEGLRAGLSDVVKRWKRKNT